MRKIKFCMLLLVISHCGVAWGNSYAYPGSRFFASQNGKWGFKVIAPEKQLYGAATGVLFSLKPDGSEQISWQKALLNTPAKVLVWDGATYVQQDEDKKAVWQTFVVTVGTWAGQQDEHPLTIYGRNGEVVRDFTLQELFTKEHLKKIAIRPRSQWWDENAAFSFVVPSRMVTPTYMEHDYNHPKLKIELKSKFVIVVELATGEVISREQTTQ